VSICSLVRGRLDSTSQPLGDLLPAVAPKPVEGDERGWHAAEVRSPGSENLAAVDPLNVRDGELLLARGFRIRSLSVVTVGSARKSAFGLTVADRYRGT
jgi:hypothetical protein